MPSHIHLFPRITALLLLATFTAVADDHTPTIEPAEALACLKAGNDRFAASRVSQGKPTAERREATAQSQHPFAIIVGCADSRTSPELIFDQNIGDLFVIRAAGNLVDDYGLGSIEYAVEHLGTRLIVVLGHERCGAVSAALASPTAPGHVNALVHAVRPAVEAVKGQPGDPVTNAVHANDALVAAKIRREATLGELSSKVRVVEGYYDLDTGKVEWSSKD